MDPSAAAMLDGVLDTCHADPLVVVAANSKNRCDVAEPGNQIPQPAQFG
jgi:hypothetical protein